MNRSEQIRAGIIALIQSALPVLNLAGILHLTSDGQSIVMLAVTNLTTLGFLLIPNAPAIAPPAK